MQELKRFKCLSDFLCNFVANLWKNKAMRACVDEERSIMCFTIDMLLNVEGSTRPSFYSTYA